jgi:hypothetical protein
MRFEINKDSKTISFEAETQAEKLQVRALEHELKEKGLRFHTWDDMHGRNGLTMYGISEKESSA